MHPFRTIDRSIVTKTAALILAIVSVLVFALILTSRQLVLSRFAALEQDDAKVHVQRVANEIDSTLDKLRAFCTDWAFWDDTFQFVTDRNAEFIASNLMDETFIDQRLNLMLFFNAQNELVHQQFFDLIDAKPAEPDVSTVKAIQTLPQLIRNDPNSSEVHIGILPTAAAPLLLVSAPIVPSLRNEPSRGRFLIGRYLNAAEIKRISTVTQLDLAVRSLDNLDSTAIEPQPGAFSTTIADGDTLRASKILADIAGRPAVAVQVTLARTMFRQGYAMWKQHAVSAVLLGIFFVVVLVLSLNKIILRRLVRMTGEIERIKEKGETAQGIAVHGRDEIGYLAEQINGMLATLHRLSASQEEKEQYLLRVLDTINCGVMVVDAEDRRISAINKAGARLLGRRPKEMIGQVCHTFACPQEMHDCPVLDHNERIDLSEGLMLRADHSAVPILKSVAAIESGGKRFLIESFVDIGPLKQAEAELRASEARYRRFFDEDLTGDFIVSVAGEIVDCNLAYARMFGYETVDEIKRTNVVSQYADPADRVRFLERLRREGKLENYKSELRRRDGSPLYCIGNEIGEFDERGELVRIRGYLFDDTKRVLLERDIRQNQKLEAIGTLAGGIAHDFNNILAGIIGYAEIILLKESADSRVREYLQKILAAGEKARELIYQILAFSRKTETILQPVQVEPVVREVVQLLRATLPSTIAIEEHCQSAASVLADSVQIHQIFLNLCTNAGHAMREAGGTLSLTLDECVVDQAFIAQHPTLAPGDYIRIRIADTGHGIPEAIRSRIFDPFFTTKGKDEGTGLGLSVVHGIVQSLNGLIAVESTPGQGTEFAIYLPLTHDQANGAPTDTLEPAQGEEHIVYVDDDPFLVEIGREILVNLGYRVTEFVDSRAAMNFLRGHHAEVDLVVSDMTMPGLTGIDLARTLREIGARTPLIIYTGYKDDLAGEQLDLLDIRKVLLKPITPQILAIKVREVLDEARNRTAG